MTAFDLRGRVALVAGAARGIGLELAWALHRRGAAVALVDLDLRAAEAAAAVGAERTLGPAADVTDRVAIQRAVGTTVERFGGSDVVVANAGIANKPARGLVIGEAEFGRVLEVDLLGVWCTVRAALAHMVARRGNVTVVSSTHAFTNGMVGGASVVLPRRWRVLSVLRGIVHPVVDRRTWRDARLQGLLSQVEAAGR